MIIQKTDIELLECKKIIEELKTKNKAFEDKIQNIEKKNEYLSNKRAKSAIKDHNGYINTYRNNSIEKKRYIFYGAMRWN